MFHSIEYHYWRDNGNAVMGAIANKGLDTELSAMVRFEKPTLNKRDRKAGRKALLGWLRRKRDANTIEQAPPGYGAHENPGDATD